MSTLLRFASGDSSGVITALRTPPIIFSSMFTGNSLRASAESCARHLSVPARRSASVCGPYFWCASDSSHFCASGLTVAGMGTMRVSVVVPSASIDDESLTTREHELRMTAEKNTRTAENARRNCFRSTGSPWRDFNLLSDRNAFGHRKVLHRIVGLHEASQAFHHHRPVEQLTEQFDLFV